MTKAVDKATAFVNELSGQGTYKIVCKASNHDIAGPKKKHVDFLIQLTNSPRSQMTFIGDQIAERLKDKNWVVVFKTLIVAHNLMTLGHERFLQCMATRSQTFSMDHFKDSTTFQAADMSAHLRKYAKYLAYLCTSYKTLAMDVGRMPKGENSPFRTMDPAKVLKSAGIIQKQLDLLLELELASEDLTNGVINTAFLMLYKDLVKLYTVYNDCMINLLEKFFEMKKPQCRETIQFYRRFLTRQEGVQTFLQLAEQVGIDKQTHLNLRQVPEDLLPALESHMGEMDALKKANSGEASPAIRAASEKLTALKSDDKKAETKTTTEASPGSVSLPSASAEVLEAQRKRFEELKRQASVPKSLDSASLSSQDSSSAVKQNTPNASQSSASDLLGLDSSSFSSPQKDPWGSSPGHSIPSAAPTSSNPFAPVSATTLPVGNGSVKSPESSLNDPWGTQPQEPSAYQEVDLFAEIRGGGANFDAVFGSNQTFTPPSQPQVSQTNAQFTLGGDILQPQAAGPLASQELLQPAKPQPGLDRDVDSSLAKAAANLSMSMPPQQLPSVTTGAPPHLSGGQAPLMQSNPIDDIHIPSQMWAVDLGGGNRANRAGVAKKTEHMWTAPKESVKTGGNNFQRQGIQARTLPAQDPTKSVGGNPVDWNKGMYGGHFPQQPQYHPPAVGPSMVGYPMVPPQQSFGMQPAPMMMQAPSNPWYPAQQQQQQQPFQPQPNDPFGTIPSQNASLF